jgi:LPXTG-motif cell wall-anchored protein
MGDTTITIVAEERSRLSTAAGVASVACAIECALRPVALFVVPIFGMRSFESAWVEFTILGLVLVLGAGGFIFRLRRRMQILRPLALFLTGYSALLTAHLVLEEGTVAGLAVALAGAGMITASHFIYRRSSGECCEFHRT